MLGARTSRWSTRAITVAVLVGGLAAIGPRVATAFPATEPDEVGMVDGLVRAIAVTGNKVWVGGEFSEVQDANGTAVDNVSNLAVFDASTGSPLTSVAVPPVTRSGGGGIVYDLSYGPDGLLYLAGSFDRVGGQVRKNVAAIDPSDGSLASFSPDTSAAKSVLATPGAIYVGTSRLLSFETNGSSTPGYDAPELETDPSLRGHNTPPQVRDMVLVGGTVVAACQCDSTIEGSRRQAAKAAIKVDADTGAVLGWTPGNLSSGSSAFGIGLIVQNDPGSGRPTVYLAAGGSDFAAAYDLANGQQVFKTDTSGSAQAVAWMDGDLYVGGHFKWAARQQAQQCGDNDRPNTQCHHAPRLIVIDPDTGKVMPDADPWNPGICCQYNGIWAITPDLGRGRLHVGGEFAKVGGRWSGSGTSWDLVGAREQSYYARFSGTPTSLSTLTLTIGGDGAGRVTSEPAAVDCSDDCSTGFVDGTGITLAADPEPGSTFVGWSGACAGSGSCVLTMDRDRAVTATFALEDAPATCGRIAYASARGRKVDIFTMTRTGANTSRLTTHPDADRDPAWSPDCSRIAFSSTRTGDGDIYVMNADGSSPERLTRSSGADTKPTWSPDGERIAFTSTRTGDADIFVMDADGSSETNLTRHRAHDRAPDWSPSGGRIAFDSNRGGGSNVWTMSSTGGSLQRLTDDEGASSAPTYSPDGSRIAFVSDRAGSRQIWVMRDDGRRARRLTAGRGNHSHPSYSPAGKRIAFADARSGSNQIWVVGVGGSGKTNVSRNDHADSTPAWS